MSGGWITQADRNRWQQRAARELAAILDDCDGLPLITWTVSPDGGLAGQVTGLAPGTIRDVFTAWRQALAIDDVLETAGSGRTWLRGRSWRGGVRITVTASVRADCGSEAAS